MEILPKIEIRLAVYAKEKPRRAAEGVPDPGLMVNLIVATENDEGG